MATYTLTDGTRKTQLTISGDATVVFPTKLDYFGVRSLDGANILVSKIKAPTVLEDGVYSTDEGDGDVVVDDGVFTDTLYLKGSGTVVVYGGAKSNHFPFKVGGKGGVRCLGTTTTELYDGSTANPIVIDGVSVTAKRNDIAFYGASEYMFNGTAWSAFGDLSGLGDLAYLDKSDIFDNTPTSGSSNGVTSDGVYKYTAGQKEYVSNELKGEIFNTYTGFTKNVASGNNSHAEGNGTTASGNNSHAEGNGTTASGLSSHAEGSETIVSSSYSHAEGANTTASGICSHAEGSFTFASGNHSHAEGYYNFANGHYSHVEGSDNTADGHYSHAGGFRTIATAESSTVIGTYNVADGTEVSDPKHLFIIGNGTANNARSNILEVSKTDMNVNGDIKQNGVPLRATTMPTITASMLGKVVQYVGASDSNYKQGWNYVAVSDGAAEPTYSWRALMDSAPTNGSNNPVTSNGIYRYTPFRRGTAGSSALGGNQCTADGGYSIAYGFKANAPQPISFAFGDNVTANATGMTAIGRYNNSRTGDLFNVGNGTATNARSNIVEVNATSLNVNGDIQKNGVSLPTPYTTMPTITESMLGQIAQYVGTTDVNYTQGWFYIASSDGAAEPTYSWVHLPTQNGYSETVLYTASSPHTNSIELSQAYTNFDDIVVVWTYSASSGGEYHNRFQQAFKTSALVADDNILVGEATSGSDFTAYTVVDTTHINFTEKAGTYYNWISKVIGIKYGSNGGAVANPVRSLAKSKEEEKPIEEEEPTDEMR